MGKMNTFGDSLKAGIMHLMVESIIGEVADGWYRRQLLRSILEKVTHERQR